MKLPILSGDEVVKKLSKIGFKFTRQSGSHMILVKENREKTTVVVPKHKELAKRELY